MVVLPAPLHRVDAADEAPQPQQIVRVVQVGPAPAAARKQREAKTGVVMQGFAVFVAQRRHHGDLPFRQLQAEGVLLADRLVGPAARPVELGDDEATVFEADLVDPVFIAVEGVEMAVATQAGALHRIEDAVGVQFLIDELRIGHGRVLRGGDMPTIQNPPQLKDALMNSYAGMPAIFPLKSLCKSVWSLTCIQARRISIKSTQ